MTTTQQHDPPKGQAFRLIVTVFAVTVSCTLCMCVIAQLLIWVPGYEQAFEDFKLKLPAHAAIVINLSKWTATYWYVVAIMCVLFLALGGFICWWTRHRVQSSLLFLFWLVIWIVAPFGILCVIWLSMRFPMQALMEGLNS